MLNVRQECVNIRMELDKAAVDRHAPAVKVLGSPGPKDIKAGDVVKINYSFIIEYWGRIIEQLKATETICADPGIVIAADCAALEEGKILVYRTLKKLKQVIETVEARNA